MKLNSSYLQSLPKATAKKWIDSLSEKELQSLRYDWSFWGRPEQQLPEGDWLTWLILAGRGFGKTRTGAEIVRAEVESGRSKRIALVAETAADARDVIVEGDSGILACSPDWFKPVYEPSKRRLTWPNGVIATLYNGTEPDQLRGPQHDFAWVDELAKYRYAQEAWDQLLFGLRLGERPRAVITTTPRPIPVIKQIIKDSDTIITRGRTLDNSANLAASFLKKITERYSGTRLGRQELDAELLDDIPGALWTRQMLDDARFKVTQDKPLVTMRRVVVAVDPSGTAGASDDGDDIGIVVTGIGLDGFGYVLADRTIKASPSVWARVAVDAYHEFNADRIVAERNFGGAMVEAVIRSVDSRISYKEVTASRGKVQRAEPIAALYEQKRVRHVATLNELEDQCCNMTGNGYLGDGSPDRVDALVWGLTELMIEAAPATPLFGTYGNR
jgi:phage terminase large subunit-like protein